MSDAIRRGVRTFFQAFIGVLISSGILSGFGVEGAVDWGALQKIAISAVAAGVVAVLTYIQNLLEDEGAVPALLKAPASSGANPVPPDGNISDL